MVIAASMGSSRAVGSARAGAAMVHLKGSARLVNSLGLLAIGVGLRLDSESVSALERTVMVMVVVAVAELGVANSHELHEEQDEDGHESDTLNP